MLVGKQSFLFCNVKHSLFARQKDLEISFERCPLRVPNIWRFCYCNTLYLTKKDVTFIAKLTCDYSPERFWISSSLECPFQSISCIEHFFTWLHSPTLHSGHEPRLQLVVVCGLLLLSHLPRPPLHLTGRSLFPFPQDTEHCREIIKMKQLSIAIALVGGEAISLIGSRIYIKALIPTICVDYPTVSQHPSQEPKRRWHFNYLFWNHNGCGIPPQNNSRDHLEHTMLYRTFTAVNKYTWLQSPTVHSGQAPGLQLLVACGFVLLSHLPLPPVHSTVRSIFPFPQDTEHWGKEWNCHFSWGGIQYKFLAPLNKFAMDKQYSSSLHAAVTGYGHRPDRPLGSNADLQNKLLTLVTSLHRPALHTGHEPMSHMVYTSGWFL